MNSLSLGRFHGIPVALGLYRQSPPIDKAPPLPLFSLSLPLLLSCSHPF
uniref:Uncharacterized protein n=1 Tax=Rhizophora mucronata TaxID=61149 RepID=A0A2P2PBT1_RHIMU